MPEKYRDSSLLVTNEVATELLEQVGRANPFRELLGPREYPPLTLRERMRVWRYNLRWSIHNWFFPDCGDDY